MILQGRSTPPPLAGPSSNRHGVSSMPSLPIPPPPPQQHNQRHNITASTSTMENNDSPTRSRSAQAQMEQVTFHLHSRLCNFGLTHTSTRTRKIFENLLLVAAICCAGALLMLHRTFVVSAAHNLSPASLDTAMVSPPRVFSSCLDRLEGFDPASADITHLVILPHNLTIESPSNDGNGTRKSWIEPKSKVLWNRGNEKNAVSKTEGSAADDGLESQFCTRRSSYEYRNWLEQQLLSNTLPITYSYSTTKAYLMLPYDHQLAQSMDVQYILVAPTDPVCFGEPFVQFLLWKCFVGGNTILLNWLLTFPAHEDRKHKGPNQQHHPSKAFVYNPRNQWFLEVGGDKSKATATIIAAKSMSSRWKKLLAKIGVFLRTSFLFFFCTTLVSFTLRETQERMLDFTRELSRRVRQSLSLSDLITTHLVHNFVFVPIMLGMMFFLIEFYDGDKFLAFSITSIVWAVEGFSLVCLRSSQGLQYFPYFFFLLFLLFHVYQTAFSDNGFVYLALTVVWCFMLHSMVFFWHRYELPAVVLGAVSVYRPRMNSSLFLDDDYNNGNGDVSRSGTATNGASNLDIPLTQQQQNHQPPNNDRLVRRDVPSSSSVARATVTSIDSDHLTTPLLTTTTTLAAGARNTSSSHLSTNSGGFLASRQSFQSISTSSRRTSELYRHNQEDDNSTGSHLYFMGGEVVLHQRRTTQAYQNSIGSNSSYNNNNINHSGNSNENSSSNSELSPPSIRRGNSYGNFATVGGAPLPALSTPTGPVPSEEESPVSSFIRNESNFSLLSATSDAYNSMIASGMSNHATINSIQSIQSNSSAIGLDVTGRWNGDSEDTNYQSMSSSFCDALHNDTSMDTVHMSNVSTQQEGTGGTHRNDNEAASNAAEARTATALHDGHCAQEAGGLKAIFESKLTPRHSNKQPEPNVPLSASGIQYQRRPPTFPELTQPN